MVSHLYKITNKNTGEYYYGKHNGTTQKDYNGKTYWGSGKRIKRQIKKYGVQNFTYEILCIAEADYIFELEKKIVTPELLQDELCLNLDIGGEGSHLHCAETRKKMRQNSTPKSFNAQQRKQISESLKEHYKNNPDTIKKQVENRKITYSTPEYKKKSSEIMKNIWQDPEYRQKLVEAHLGQEPWNKGKKMSPEQLEKMTAASREYWKDKPGFMTGKKHTDETKDKLKAAWEKRKKNKSGLTSGYIAINNKETSKFVKPEVLDEYLNNGWIKGLKSRKP